MIDHALEKAIRNSSASAGCSLLAVIRNHRCGIRDAENAHAWPEFQALVARIKANEIHCEAEDDGEERQAEAAADPVLELRTGL